MQVTIPEYKRIEAALLNIVGCDAGNDGGPGTLEAAIATLRRATAINPLDLGSRINLAAYLIQKGEDDEAETLCNFVLKFNENEPVVWQQMGVINTNRGRMDEATACFKRAYDIDPTHSQRKWDIGAAYLRTGDWLKGWPFYEHRGEILPKTGGAPDAPVWRGEKTGHLAIWPDQGHGDVIMFSRFVPWAAERAEKVTFFVSPRMLALMNGYSAVAEVASAYDEKTVKFDHQICVSSLPLVYGLTPYNIPPDPGLLSAATTTNRLEAEGLKIGIAWQGNPQFPGDRLRRIPFAHFLPIAADPRNAVFSLQCGAAAADIYKARAQRIVKDMSTAIEGEWTLTAALIKNLDLVVTSCTAIAHLAGALGVPSFIMLPVFADWRWMTGRDDTPWYAHTRLFRQAKAGAWEDVVKRVLTAIEGVHCRRDLVARLAPPRTQAAQEYEPDVAHVMRKVLRPGDTFIDVGANRGVHTVVAAKLVGEEGRVIAIEPGGNVLPELRAATAGLPQVHVVEQPAWCDQLDVTFFLNADNSGGNAMWDPGDWPGPENPKSKECRQPVAMRTTTLDRIVLGHHYVPRLIKIDTEGAEQRVLEGAEKMLEGMKPPFIVAELHEFGLDKLGCSQDSLRAFMASHGYSTFVLAADGSLPKFVPPGTAIRSRTILNLLFAIPEDVGSIWSESAA